VRLPGTAFLVLFLLAACGQLPRPYQPVEKSVDLAALIREETIAVAAPAGMPADTADAFRAAVVKALVAAGLPAAADDVPGSRQLSITVDTSESAGREIVLSHWRYEAGEAEAAQAVSLDVSTAVPAESWGAGDPIAIQAVADAGARRLAARLEQPADGPPPIPGFADARVVVLPVEGAPGDGDESLEKAVTEALKASDVRLAALPEADDLLLQGTVQTTPPKSGEQGVRITWILISAQNFREIGRVSQANVVPAGSLNGRWGETASAVADAARDGILNLLEQAAEAKRRALLAP